MARRYEQLWDRPLAGEDKQNEAPHLVGNICYLVLGFLCKILWRYKVYNREVLRSFRGKSGVLLVGNHTSYLDVVFAWLSVRASQWLRFMARDTLFPTVKGMGGWLFSRVGAFPVSRDSADRTSLKRAARMLKNKEVVGIFPEGTRRGKSGTTPKLHAGAALIARMGNAPLLPFTVQNVEKIKHKGQRVRFPKVNILFAQPVYLESFDFLPKSERLEACTWYVMRECFALNKGIRADQVDMVQLFPDSKDYSQVFAEYCIQAPII